MLFSVVDKQVDAVKLVTAICEDTKAKRETKTRFCTRLIPFQTTSFAAPDTYVSAMRPIIEAAFKDREPTEVRVADSSSFGKCGS